MTNINNINLNKWKEYDDILTDSLWFIGNRDNSGNHNNAYHGNFTPQIPNQLMRRFTKKGDVVLDLFLGYGSTLIESKRLGRHGTGVELIPKVAKVAQDNIGQELPLIGRVISKIIVADSTTDDAKSKVTASFKRISKERVHFILLHPPYHDIIQFSGLENDICNCRTIEEFTAKFRDVIENFTGLLGRNRYLAVVIGDKYTNSEWVPLGFYS